LKVFSDFHLFLQVISNYDDSSLKEAT